MKFFEKVEKAAFLTRPNRYIVHCELDGRRVKAYLPNPGRLHELLLPRALVYLTYSDTPGRKTKYTAVAVEGAGQPILLHTHLTNDVAGHLLVKNRVPGFEGAMILRREVTRGHSRFDFLLEHGGEQVYLEVKSCTLISARAALFPDAVTARGKRHIEELAELGARGTRTAVLFVVHHWGVHHFLPDYHTDPEFARALIDARPHVKVLPLAVQWKRGLVLGGATRELEIPWSLIERETGDRGSYLLILRCPRATSVEVGKMGRIRFEKGYYIYTGSAMTSLSKRIARHQRLRKKKFWHIDYLREKCEVVAALPIITGDDLECALAKAMGEISDHSIPGFGSSDCACDSHLFHMAAHPFHSARFHALLYHFRTDRFFEGTGR